MWIDSHCHIDHGKIRKLGAPGEIVTRARAAGVAGLLNICCRISDEFPEVLAQARAHEDVWCTIGTHPHEAGDPAEKAVTFERLVDLACSDPKIVGIGETGLDYFYGHSTPEDQRESFRRHLRACRETGLPVVVHARDADEDVARILKEESGGGALRGVLHCFSSGRELAEAALALGFYVSFSGIVTFKKADALRAIAKDIPADRILIETDAPYLAPEPVRSAVNEPANIVHTGRVLAALHGVSEVEMARRTRENFFALFERAKIKEGAA